MKQELGDPGAFLKALEAIRESTFLGTDLAHDDTSGHLTLDLRSPGERGGLLGRRRWRKVRLRIHQVENYRQSLAKGPDSVYILDRAEIGRGGRELVLYFRPGDRAVMDVDRIEATLEDSGEIVSGHGTPTIANPLSG